MRTLPILLAVSLPLATACSDKVDIDGIDGLPLDSIAYSFYARESGPNGDGGTLTAQVVVLTDRADMCEAAEAVGGVAAVDDMFAVQIISATNGNPGAVESNAALADLLLDPNGSQGLVAARVYERRGGETLLSAASLNVVQADVISPGDVTVNSVSSGPDGSKLGGTFESQLDADLTNGSDYTPLSATVKGRFAGAIECDAVGGAVEVPDDPGGGGGECDDVRYDNPNPGGGSIREVEFGDVCAGTEDRMTYNVGTGCTTRLDINVPDAFDGDTQTRDVSLELFYAGGGGTDPTPHSTRTEREIDDLRVYLEGGGDSHGAVTARIRHVAGDGAVPYELTVLTECP